MQSISVIILNTDTTLFSPQPDNSKWWCNGAILNILFPVLLKYSTCNITDTVSNTGISAIIIKINGIFKYNANATITPPSNSEPVSPINTFAGCMLNSKNPRHAPITIVPNITTSFISYIIPITVRHVIIIADTVGHNPSTPVC